MSRPPRREPVSLSELLALANTIPTDLIALELRRREIKARTKPGGCRYRLYRAERTISEHEWIVAHKDDWRTARKALKYATERQETQA